MERAEESKDCLGRGHTSKTDGSSGPGAIETWDTTPCHAPQTACQGCNPRRGTEIRLLRHCPSCFLPPPSRSVLLDLARSRTPTVPVRPPLSLALLFLSLVCPVSAAVSNLNMPLRGTRPTRGLRRDRTLRPSLPPSRPRHSSANAGNRGLHPTSASLEAGATSVRSTELRKPDRAGLLSPCPAAGQRTHMADGEPQGRAVASRDQRWRRRLRYSRRAIGCLLGPLFLTRRWCAPEE